MKNLIIITIVLLPFFCKAQRACDTINAVIVYSDTTNIENVLVSNAVIHEIGYVVAECSVLPDTDIEVREFKFYDRFWTEITLFVINWKIIE